jgi:hypothetical protein
MATKKDPVKSAGLKKTKKVVSATNAGAKVKKKHRGKPFPNKIAGGIELA